MEEQEIASALEPVDIDKMLKGIKVGIPGQEYLTYEIELTGIRPGILMNRLDPEVLAFPGVKSTERVPKGSVVDIEIKKKKKTAEASGGTNIVAEGDNIDGVDPKAALKVARGVGYFLPGKNDLCCPAENLQAMALGAARSWPKTGMDRMVGSSLFVEGYQIPFLDPKTDEPLVFDDRAIVVANQYLETYPHNVCALVKAASSSRGKKILTSRIFLPNWKLKFRVRYDASMVTKQSAEGVIAKNIWQYAGGYIGQMSWRPSAPRGPGPFGKFVITKYAQVK